MNGERTQVVQLILAISAGVAITIACVVALAALNRSEVVAEEAPSFVRTVSLDGGGGGSPAKGTGGDPQAGDQVATKSEEIMSVDLDAAPVFDAPVVAALDISPVLPAPSVDAIQVFVGHSGNIATPGATAVSASHARGVPGGTGQGTGTGGTGNGTGGGSGGGNGTGSGTGNGSGIGDADHVDQPPREPSGNAKPAYPDRERQLGIEGTVMIKLLIDERGRVEDVQIISGPEAFRRAVLQVARTWRFEPARDKGRVLKVWGTKEVKFTHPRNRG
jgi:protein TonB